MTTKDTAKEPEKGKTAEKPVQKQQMQAYETRYAIEELVAAAAALFHEEQIVVSAALKSSGKTEYTEKEAQAIVKVFAKKEVK